MPLKRASAALRRGFGRDTIGHDAAAGIALGVESVPDGLASGLLAGVNPVAGLYAYLFGTIGGATLTSTPFLAVQSTGAIALLVADVDLASRPDPGRALFTLSVLTGVVMVVAGLLRAGSLLRFVPTAVMVGFISAVGVNIVLGQLPNLTGYEATGANRVARTFDLLTHPGLIDGWSLLVGLVTIALIVVLSRTPLRSMGLVVAIGIGSVMAAWLRSRGHVVAVVDDLAVVPGSLPSISWPALGDVPFLAIPAVSLAFVGMIQGSAVSAAFPARDGSTADPSRDFVGQGVGNVAAGLFQGMPVGGSMSATSLVVAGGARTRMSLFIAGGVMAVVILTLSGVVGLVAMPALAGLLITVGARAVKPAQIAAVNKTERLQTVTMTVTFVLTLLVPLQYAVLAGVGLAVVLHVVGQSNRVVVHRLRMAPDGRMREEAVPAGIGPREVIVLQPYGSLFFASASVFEAQLPAVDPTTDRSVVIVRLRGVDHLGLGFIDVLRRYERRLTRCDSKLVIVCNNGAILDQIGRAGLTDVLGNDNVYEGTEWLGEAVQRAHRDATEWIGREG